MEIVHLEKSIFSRLFNKTHLKFTFKVEEEVEGVVGIWESCFRISSISLL